MNEITPRSSIEEIRARTSQPVTEIVANPREYFRVQQLLRDRLDLLAHYDELVARPALTYSKACALLAAYAVAVQDRLCCGDELQPALDAALKACTDAMGTSPDPTGGSDG